MLRVHPAWLLILALVGCRRVPTEKERQGAEIHYELGLNAQQTGSAQDAYSEFIKALELDPDYPEAHNALAILLHLSFRKLPEAIQHYQQALELRPTFSEAKTNLGNVYLEMGRYDEAIKLYEESLNDMLYPTPFIAQGNLGWAQYKKGQLDEAIGTIKSAVTTNPSFCLGYKNLGIIYQEKGDTAEACVNFGRYREACPDVADAWLREGACQARLGQVDAARNSFATCEAKAKVPMLRDECRKLREAL